MAHHVGVIFELGVALLELRLQAGPLPYLGLELRVRVGELGGALGDLLLEGLVGLLQRLLGLHAGGDVFVHEDVVHNFPL